MQHSAFPGHRRWLRWKPGGNRGASLRCAELAGLATPPPDGRFVLPDGGHVEAADSANLIRDAGMTWVRQLRADWLLCINSTVILPGELLTLFGGRALNCHPGLLPEYGGLHAHQWAIRHGVREYGATVHRMDTSVDSGAIVATDRFPICESDTGLTLYRTTMAHAIFLLIAVATRLSAREDLQFIPQDLSARRVYRRRDALDGHIDWQQPARAVVDFVRAGNYEPFRSPTYTACCGTPSGISVEVLRCELAGSARSAPGQFVVLRADGPLIACGDGYAVCIRRAREAGRVVDAERWPQLLAKRMRMPPAVSPPPRPKLGSR
jgi:methionyl-tRNA formyltransferase